MVLRRCGITHYFPGSVHETLVGLGVKQQNLTRSPACQTSSLRAHGCRCRKRELTVSGEKCQGTGMSLSRCGFLTRERGRQELVPSQALSDRRFARETRHGSKRLHSERGPNHCEMFK